MKPMNVAYTGRYEEMLSMLPFPRTIGQWIDFPDRARHIQDRCVTDAPMTIRSIAGVTGLDPAPVLQAWRSLRSLRGTDQPSNAGLGGAEPWQARVADALRVLERRRWTPRPELGHVAQQTPAFQGHAQQQILSVLRQGPEGMVELIAAWMVLMATTPEEVDEAWLRWRLASLGEPALVRELKRTLHGIVELWYLPPARHERVRDVELVVVRTEALVVPDPDDREQGVEAGVGAGLARVQVLGGRQNDNDLGTFRRGRDYLADTRAALERLSATGTLTSGDPHDDEGRRAAAN